MYDIIFISYKEPNADENFAQLKERFPTVKRVHGVKGIHQAHIAAAKKAFTKMFWVVDADAIITNDFNFDYEVPHYDLECVHVWQSRNPLNNLVYGYGGVKLLPRRLTIKMDVSKPDMTTSISSLFKSIPEVSNITAFNTTAFNTWRSAFRECVKLTINSDFKSKQRLNAWLHPVPNADFRHDAKQGAEQGQTYALANKDNLAAIRKINDFDWLKEQYESRT